MRGEKKGIDRDSVDLSKQRPGLEAKALDRRSSPFPEARGSHLICLSVTVNTDGGWRGGTLKCWIWQVWGGS